MTTLETFTITGIAIPTDTTHMLDEIAEHFVEHSEVERGETTVVLSSEYGRVETRAVDGRLLIEITCPTAQLLEAIRTVMAEHLFMFAGDEPLELTWSDSTQRQALPDLHEVTVVSVSDITPRMRRVVFECADPAPFLGGGFHVRLLIPPKDRTPVWPTPRPDGRIAWPEGEDALAVRVYTIRAVDPDRRQLTVDFLQHHNGEHDAPGGRFARDARPGDRLALLGPGGGGLPPGRRVLLAGDETALPAIARIAAEAAPETTITALVEIEDDRERQALPSQARVDLRWLVRDGRPAGAAGLLPEAIAREMARLEEATYVWVGCGKNEARIVRESLKACGHDRHAMSVAAYWQP
ncbi:DUF2218 domain-containing protein [Ciceribacter sp. L1K22]|uniref:DUF2218 domain-containing protein n=1 Tax=Ciceribacter sp. L1K22 TaxID=2820275 RepID=UPI001ABE6B3F|nr:DUF2218 domain-containing protein [Ciceribacter sp. L1K22]MBO3762332.1 DUF2218 domain-containing protein [Ciceribacter sp. L1K22]